MRAQLALLAAGAVVFAPAWSTSGAPEPGPTGTELAGRILAPSFDRAAAVSQLDRGAFLRPERARPRGDSSRGLAAHSAALELRPFDRFWIVVGAALLVIALGAAPSVRSPRAPPQLLAA